MSEPLVCPECGDLTEEGRWSQVWHIAPDLYSSPGIPRLIYMTVRP